MTFTFLFPFRTTSILMVIAAILIVNSHLESMYPFSWLAADGLLGNSMFFLLIGYGIFESTKKNSTVSFGRYYLKKVLRIYPSLLVVVMFFCFIPEQKWKLWTLTDYFYGFIFPSRFVFIQQVMIYYIPLYFIVKSNGTNTLISTFSLLFIPYLMLYVHDFNSVNFLQFHLGSTNKYVWYIFYFQMALLGGFLSRMTQKNSGDNFFKICLIGVLLISAYIAFKYLVIVGFKLPVVGLISRYWFLMHIISFLITFFCFNLATSKPVIVVLKSQGLIYKGIGFIGGLTLEMYLVHGYLIENSIFKNLQFPLNVVTLFCSTILISSLIIFAIFPIRNILTYRTNRK